MSPEAHRSHPAPRSGPRPRAFFRRWIGLVRISPALLTLGLLASACGRGSDELPTQLRFWVMGREGELVQELVRDFESQNPDVRVEVQQIPWSAAHEKLLTAFVGRATPDLAQLGNTWIAEFSALRALEPLNGWLSRATVIQPDDYFAGIWDTNVIDTIVYGVPWYVDTRVIFYRSDILERAGHSTIPGDWQAWLEALRDVKAVVGPDRHAIFLPLNEWTQPALLGLQAGSPLLRDRATRGAFSEPEFRRGFDFYLSLFEEGLAPSVGNNEIANIYQEFARGRFAMLITGPWNLGEFRNRLPEELADAWSTAPLPGPDGAVSGVSMAGGSSLVVFRHSAHKEAAWRLLEFLSEPAQQLRFYELSGDLPPRASAWREGGLNQAPRLRAFWEQLQRVVALPRVPEWELIALRLQESTDRVVRGGARADSAMARLDRSVADILHKRRWLLERAGELESGDASP